MDESRLRRYRLGMTPDDPIVTVDFLSSRLGAPDLRVIDATWRLPGDTPDGRTSHEEARIPGAVFFDLDLLSDKSSGLPHMLPDPQSFAEAVGNLGIGDGARIVIYDSVGLFSAPRVWWTFRAMGVEDVQVLDGGLPAWIAAGHAVETGPPPTPSPRRFTARLRNDLVVPLDRMRTLVERDPGAIVDARPADRFRGEAPEPRPGLKPGHMPGALNLPFGEVIADGKLKSAAALRKVFSEVGVEPAGVRALTCGSGVTAAVLALALARIGRSDAPIYDGSWAEWGALRDAPAVTGPAK